MKNFVKAFFILLLASGYAYASNYELNKPHSNIGFVVKHMMITNVAGNFKSYDAVIDFDESKKIFNKLEATIDTNSIYTGIDRRDNHLRSDDFFSVEKFPQISFKMTSYKAHGDQGKMTGDLTIKGVTKRITLDIEDISVISNKIGFAIEGKINRTDFGLKWNQNIESGGVVVAEEVKLRIDIQADKNK